MVYKRRTRKMCPKQGEVWFRKGDVVKFRDGIKSSNYVKTDIVKSFSVKNDVKVGSWPVDQTTMVQVLSVTKKGAISYENYSHIGGEATVFVADLVLFETYDGSYDIF